MTKSFKTLPVLAVVAAVFSLTATETTQAGMVLTQATQPAGTTSLFNAIGTLNFGNQKARLESAGQPTQQGGNPGNGWWNNQLRSWDVTATYASGSWTINFNVYASSDWTGAAAMTMTRNPVLTAGNALVGLDIGGRLNSTSQSLTIGSVAFDSTGTGSSYVAVTTANGSYSGNQFFNNFHSLSGLPSTFKLRGTAIFPTGSVTSDSMRFFIDGRQGPAPLMIPAPGAALLGVLGLSIAGWAKRRMA